VRDVLLMDTNVVSLAGRERPPPGLRPWLAEIGTERLAISYPVIAELFRGAHLVRASNPKKADQILEWVAMVRNVGFRILPMTLEVADVYAKMTSLPRLKHLWTSDGKSKKGRLGHDLMIAAVSIVHRAPILTGNAADFLVIERSFPLPGLYDPFESSWHVAPIVDANLPVYDVSVPDPHGFVFPQLAAFHVSSGD
jgi:predicted nucleic acid-binding protein